MTGAICIDGYNLALPRGSGIATYSRTLLQGVKALGLQREVLHAPLTEVTSDPLLRETLVGDARWRLRALAEPQSNRRIQAALARFGRTAHRVEPTGRVLWPECAGAPEADAFWLSQDLFRIANRAFTNDRVMTPVRFDPAARAPDLMHWTHPTPLKGRGVPNIYTLHDLIPLKLPHTTLDDKRRFLDLCRKAAAQADHLVAVSETTRRDAIEWLGIDEDRITTTWQAADLPAGALDRSDAEVANEIDDVFGLDWRGYFLFFGAVEPKKNLGRLVEAYLRSGVKSPLVVVGARAWMADQEVGFLEELIAGDAGAARRLRRYDHLPRAALMSLVRGARSVAFPSLYEGFGLPALEAMMLGAPVIASSGGALPEIVGDAALLADPHDIEAMAKAFQALDADEDLRRDLALRGVARAETFSPRAYAERLGRLYGRFGLPGV